jgi:hypothetical protein
VDPLPTLLLTLLGVAVLLVTLWDVVLTVLHVDQSGPLGSVLQRGTWMAAVAVGRRWPGVRRDAVSLAGPAMIVLTFGVWVGLWVLGFALLYWPRPDAFTAYEVPPLAGFLAALYYSGNVATVLGFGDIVPISTGMRLVSIVQGIVGFALLSGGATFLLSVVNGVTGRNALVARLDDETGGTFSGVVFAVRLLRHQESASSRLQGLLGEIRQQHETMRQFPILDLYHRSRDAQRDPERLFVVAIETSLALRLATHGGTLEPFAEELQRATARLLELVADQHLSSAARSSVRSAVPDAEAFERLAALGEALRGRGVTIAALDAGAERELAAFEARSRAFLDGLDRLTSWRVDLGA